ncbi:reverse transcriptase domain-containing protein [Tanacetum coccineum]
MKALMDLQSPRTLKEMQSLSGKLAALNRFLAKSAERSLPFFNTLKNITKKNKHEYRWTHEAGEAFQQMKNLITDLPSLTPPQEKETLYAYLAVSTEKLALSLIHMTRRLRRYFEAYPVKVITDQPIKNILSNTETSSKLAKYAVELGAYNITFIPRNAVKGQVLADFLSEVPEGEKEESPKGSSTGLVLIGPSGIEYTYALRLTFPSTNNEAEYEALLAGLRIARQMNISNIEVKVDSKLVESQINGS